MKNKCTVYIPIEKIDKKKKMVYGYATTEEVDSQGEVVEKGAIRKAWDDYMQWANVREMHQLSAVGKTKKYLHDDKGTWIGVKVIDKTAWEKVIEQVYNGFSIGGDVLKKEGNRIKEIVLSEISLVDRPSCPGAKFEMVKRDNSGELINKQKVDSRNIKDENMPEEIKKEEEVVENSGQEPEEVEKTVEGDEPDKEEVEENTTEEEVEEQEKDDDIEEEVEEEDEEEDEEEEDEEEEEVEKKDDEDDDKEKMEKDVKEMTALTEITSNLDYLVGAFKTNERSSSVTSKMEEALQILLEATRLEAKRDDTEKVQKVESFDGLSKVLKEELGEFKKSFEESNAKVEELSKEVTSLKEQVDGVKKKKNTPKTTYTIEKAEEPKGENTLESLRGEMKDILEEIEKAHGEAKAIAGTGDTGRQEQISQKLDDLQKRFSTKKAELREFSQRV